MNHIKSLMLATLATGFMTTVATEAHAQNSEIRSNAIQKKSVSAVRVVDEGSGDSRQTIVQLRVDDVKDSKRIEQKALSRSLAPKIRRAAERQGVKASNSDILEASDKLASIMSNSDILDLGDAIAGISIKISIKFGKPMEIGIEITF